MINVGFKNRCQFSYNNRTLNRANNQNSLQTSANNDSIHFNGIIDCILSNKPTIFINKNVELNHISNVLKTLGVKELEIGNNIKLARLLKSAMYRVKELGFDVPERIRCESNFFIENQQIKEATQKYTKGNKIAKCPGAVRWNCQDKPILYLNTGINWKKTNGELTRIKDPRNSIWHETGHYLHMMNYKDKPFMYEYISHIRVDMYQKGIVEKTIGLYAADNPVNETVAEIFARFVSGESYDKLHPEIFNIYHKYNGPMPHKI